MPWLCKSCNNINANVTEVCYYCLYHIGKSISRREGKLISSFDEIDLSVLNYEIYKLEKAERNDFTFWERVSMAQLTEQEIDSNPNMSPKEKLFAKFFASEKKLVSEMDDGNLRAHIEELQNIAFEARARLTASADEAQERAAKKKRDKGFSTSVQTDDFTSEAINNINERQKKMSKVEKEIERLVGLGVDRKDAENMYRASTQNTIKREGVKAVIGDNKEIKNIVNSIVNASESEKKAFTNPFAPKEVEEEVKSILVTNIEQTVVEVKQINQEEKKAVAFNPFAKKG